MLRFIFSVIAIAFGLGLVVVSALSVGQKQVQGQANIETLVASPILESEASDAAQPLESDTSQTKIEEETPPAEYFLPYPGLLPDHALYPLKMIRDRVILSLASKAEKRFELQLLFANKRIGAAKVLVFGNKKELGIDTAVKAQGYLSQALESAKRLDSGDHWYELHQAAKIHQELIAEMITHLGNDNISRLQTLQDNNQEILEATSAYVVTDEEPKEDETVDPLVPAEFGN